MRKPACGDKGSFEKDAWSNQEDQKLIDYIQVHGEGYWRSIPKAAGLHRSSKSCRLRWLNYLRPDIKPRIFAEDEEDLIIKLHALLGNRWSLIAGRLPGRTDKEVKNYWNSHIQRKLTKMGIDPNSHKLHQTFPPLRSVGASSCESFINKEHNVYNTERVSLAKCLEEETPIISSPPLNLDLTIALPSPRICVVEDKPTSTIDLNC